MAKSTKKILIGVVAVVAVAAGGAWYWASGKAMVTTQRLITSLNSSAPADGSSVKLTYEKIGRSMFPNIGVRLLNPTLVVALPASQGMREAVTVEWKRTGTVDVITDYLAHEYRVSSRGTGHIAMTTGDKKVNAESTDSTLELKLKAKSYAAFNEWNRLDFNNMQAVFAAAQNIAVAGVDMGPITVKDATTGTPIISQEKLHVLVNNRSTESMFDFDLEALMKDSQVSPAYTGLVSEAMSVLQPAMVMDFEAMPFAATRAGKQDIDIAAHVVLPRSDGQPSPHGVIDISRLTLKNDFYTIEMPTNIVFNEANGERRGLVKLDWMLDAKPAGAGEVQRMIDSGGALTAMLTRRSDQDKPAVDPVLLKQKITEALPTLTTLGPVKLTVDLEAVAPVTQPGSPPATEKKQTITVRTVALTNKRWGIDLRGHGERDTATNAEFKLTCTQCDTMAGDLVLTAQQFQDVMNLINPQPPKHFVDETTLGKLTAALAEVGSKDAAGNIVFNITTPAPGDIRVNDKPYMEAMTHVMMAVTPPPPPYEPVAPVPPPIVTPKVDAKPAAKKTVPVKAPAAKH